MGMNVAAESPGNGFMRNDSGVSLIASMKVSPINSKYLVLPYFFRWLTLRHKYQVHILLIWSHLVNCLLLKLNLYMKGSPLLVLYYNLHKADCLAPNNGAR